MHKFSEFGDTAPQRLEGNQVKIIDFLNREIVVQHTDVFNSIKNVGSLAATIQFALYEDGVEDYSDKPLYIIKTGSEVILKQVQQYKEQEPYMTVIKQVPTADNHRYYTFT